MTELTAYGSPLETIPSFKYLVRILLESDDEWPAVVHNLRKVRKKWALLSRVLGREREDAQTKGLFYVVVVQVVLMYGLETWVISS